MRKFTALVVAIALLLAAFVTFQRTEVEQPSAISTPSANPNDPMDLTGFYSQKLSWTNCGGGFECANLAVPLNYAKPYEKVISRSEEHTSELQSH